MSLRFAELFAGAGGLTMGLERAGWESAWHAEIADAPRAILAHHWPTVPLLGDVTTLDGGALTALHGPITLLCGGSPCQDLSVAGKRAGLQGARSGLFYQQMRLWEETGADLCLWENVDGARSSNNGQDFGEVLRAFVGAALPVPSDGWRSAGVAAGPRGVAAWRVLDAQFFGVPQRRRRVFVLGTRTGSVDPAEILSLAESLRGDSEASGEAGERTAAGSREGAERTRWVGVYQQDEFVDPSGIVGSLAHASNTHSGNHQPKVFSFDWQKGNDVINPRPSTMNVRTERTDSLRAQAVPAVLALDGEGNAMEDRFGCLNAHHSPHNRGAICITGEQTHALTHEGADASEDGTMGGAPIIAPPIVPGDHAGSYNGMDAVPIAQAIMDAEVAATLNGAQRQQVDGAMTAQAGIPRRLMPVECEALMGWPRNHTLVPDAKGRLLSDAARYKACGNGVASPVAHWIGWRLREALEASLPHRDNTLSSSEKACGRGLSRETP